MIRNYILFFFFSAQLSAQYGLEGAVLAALDVGITYKEMNHLKHISEIQDKLVVYSSIIAAESIAIAAIDKRILDQQSELKPAVDQLKMIIELSTSAANLIKYQNQIMELVQSTPELIPFATNSQLKILSDAGYIMADLYVYSKQSKTNLLSNKDRIDIIIATQKSLDYLIKKSVKLLDFLEMTSKTNFSADLKGVSISKPIQETISEIQTIQKQ